MELSKQIHQGKVDPKIYRGENGYASYLPKTVE